ncbi:hypothetical protein BASA81_015193 [Batrachochytrium salamandrivorans]|nr:hypothetical protein BASA81_015193 [Batrachochytrium salamandrivorans]
MSSSASASTERVQFECILSNPRSIRNFAAAFSCLYKLGKDVTLEANQATKTLTLRQVNPAKTSFLAFDFRGEFFEHFTLPHATSTCAKLKLKSCQAVFRAIKPMERLVLSLVALSNTKHVVMFRSDCRHEVTKTHQFYFEESEGLDPVFDRGLTKHRIRVNPKFLLDVLGNIHGPNEIDFVCTAGIQVKISSVAGSDHPSAPTNTSSQSHHHQQQQQQAQSLVNTEMLIPMEKFEEFEISESTAALTFSIREWRELLKFCDSSSREVDDLFLLFNDSGMPLMLTSEPVASHQDDAGLAQFAFTLVLSTIPATSAEE